MNTVTGGTRSGSTRRGVALSIFAGSLNIIANIAMFPVVVSQIGADDYGIWLFMLAVASYFFYTDIGIGTAIVYFGASARGGDRRFTSDALISNGLAWIGCIAPIAVPAFFTIAFAYAHTHGTHLTTGTQVTVAVLGASVVASIVFRPFESVLIGSGHVVRDRMNQVVGTAIRVVTVLAMLPFGLTVTQVAAAEATGMILPPVLATAYVLRHRMARPRRSEITRANIRTLFSYSAKSFMVDALLVGTLQAGTVIVGLTRGPASAAYFAMAMRVFNGAGQVLNWATAPIRPAFSRLSQLDRPTAVTLSGDLLTVVATVGVLTIAPLAWATPAWIPLWVPDDGLALGMVATTVLTLVALLARAVQLPVVLSGDSFGRPGLSFPATLGAAVLQVVLGVWLTHSCGIIGAGVAVAAALWITQPWCAYALARAVGPPPAQMFACLALPATVAAAGSAAALATAAAAVGMHWPPAWFGWVGYAIGAIAVMLSPGGRNVVEKARRLLDLPM
ncbi:hypothetical protein P0W64_13840 [Tsukamurella sp. 8F]|uniref:lipopolysaccharide biosynthesis protein n=1 Tax=unclassified Tsukamurella TaxID=2633480 RepID=UPI0023B98AA8|nr:MULTISPECIES: hypothetical protein [unclassified Tsukamurella]MDF0530654.1 hypothetical protein [Tsukamurella sp. 8J]MDF0587855.1 hypothetical protein [Tsukamurella sp. 8F]